MDDWIPEPLVAAETPFEELENEKRPVIVGYVRLSERRALRHGTDPEVDLPHQNVNCPPAGR